MNGGNLYQLFRNQFGIKNGYVIINGPYDKYGRIISGPNERGVYLIRGIGNIKPRDRSL